MDAIPESPYFYFPPDTLHRVRAEINMDRPGEMKEAVRILDEWIKQEPYFLEKYIPSHYLEMTIVTSKGSIERAKRLIKNICTARTLRPDLFEARDVRDYYEIYKDNYIVVTFPRLTADYHRLLVLNIRGNVTNTVLDAVYKYNYSCLDYIKVNDYHSGLVLIFDMMETNMQYFLTHANFLEMGNCCLRCLNAYGMRLKRIHIITPSKAINTVLSIFKTFMPKKIMDRIVVNESPKELLNYYSEDVLAEDYGGTERSLQELQEEILYQISKSGHIEHMKTMNRVQIDKSMCPVDHLRTEDAVQGTFRTLNID